MRIIFCILALVLFSCEVQKRRYSKGFYLSSSHRSKHQRLPAAESQKTEPSIETSAKKTETPNPVRLQTGEHPAEITSVVNSIGSLLFNTKKNLVRTPPDSCDVLLFKDGSEVRSKIIEISPTEIKYKKCDLPDGPVYVTRKSDLFMFTLANGARELIKSEPEAQRPSPNYDQNRYIPPPRSTPRDTHPAAPLSLIAAILSFMLAYVGLLTSFFNIQALGSTYIGLTVLAAILAVGLGVAAANAIKAKPDTYKGSGVAITGIIIGAILLFIYALISLLLFL
jgi:hypothetical protein